MGGTSGTIGFFDPSDDCVQTLVLAKRLQERIGTGVVATCIGQIIGQAKEDSVIVWGVDDNHRGDGEMEQIAPQ